MELPKDETLEDIYSRDVLKKARALADSGMIVRDAEDPSKFYVPGSGGQEYTVKVALPEPSTWDGIDIAFYDGRIEDAQPRD